MELVLATEKDIETIWNMQIKAFSDLLKKYEDYETNPGNETIEIVRGKFLQPETSYYLIKENNLTIGAIRVVDAKNGTPKRISPLFILKEYRNKGYAQMAMNEVERIHGKTNWTLSTILQESGNCYLYEKMGYHRTGNQKIINNKMTIIFYEKE